MGEEEKAHEQLRTDLYAEQFRAALYESIKNQQATAEHLCEVATPGIVRRVSEKDMK